MASLTEPVLPVDGVRDATDGDRIHSICRDAVIPTGRSVAAKVRAIAEHYSRGVGRELPAWDAIRELDRIVAERDDMPFPAAYGRVVDHLIRADYDPESVHAIVAHLRRGGDVTSSPGLDPGHRSAVARMLPRGTTPGRSQLGD
jgi:hypothetical protein